MLDADMMAMAAERPKGVTCLTPLLESGLFKRRSGDRANIGRDKAVETGATLIHP